MRRRFATLAVAALLVVAGCSAGGDDTTTPEYDTDADPLYETPLDPDTVVDSHVDALREYGTFTVDVNVTWERDSGDRTTREILARANLDTGAVYEHREFDGDVQQAYSFGNDTAYYRTVSDGDVSYGEDVRGVLNASSYAKSPSPLIVEMFTFTYAGTKTVGGERVHVYRANGPDRADLAELLPETRSGNATVDHAEATLSFREDGTLQRLDYTLQFEIDDESRLTSIDLRIEKLGDTDTSPPLWIPAARNATG